MVDKYHIICINYNFITFGLFNSNLMPDTDLELTTETKPEKLYYCPKCGSSFHFQLHRAWFVKTFLYFLPVRKYFCAKCRKAYYIRKS